MYLPIKWGVKEPPANPQNHRVVNMSSLKSSRALIRKGSSSSPGFLIPWIYPPKTQDAIVTTRMTSGWLGGSRSDKLSFATNQHPSGGVRSKFYNLPQESSNLKFLLVTGDLKDPKEPEPTQKNPSQTVSKLLLNLEGRLSILIPFSADSLRVETEALALVLVLHQARYLWKFLSGTERLLLPAVGRLGHFSLRIQTFC